MVFPVVMYGCESWTIKKAEHWRIDAFELWYWRLLRVPWTARRSNQSILKEIRLLKESFIGRTDVEAETPVFWPPDAKSWLIGKTLMLAKIEGRRRRGWQRMRWLDGITDSMDMGLGGLLSWWCQVGLVCCNSWGRKEADMTEWLNWTDPSIYLSIVLMSPCLIFLSRSLINNTLENSVSECHNCYI